MGLNETEAKDEGSGLRSHDHAIDELDRAIADEEAHGVVKVLTAPGKDRILGATIVGAARRRCDGRVHQRDEARHRA